MASDKEFLNYVLEQLSDLKDVDYKKMMGEYILYYNIKRRAKINFALLSQFVICKTQITAYS